MSTSQPLAQLLERTVQWTVLGFIPCVTFAQSQVPLVEVDGFLRADWTASSAATGTFGRVNQVAITEAAPQSAATDTAARSAWNLAQSRLGVTYNPFSWGSLRGETDFVDFDQASATTTLKPRLRVLKAVFRPSDTQTIEVGQDWDILAPPKPFTYNYVGLFFRAGNTGFMRPQIRWTAQWGALETSVMTGLQGINTAASDSSSERSIAPFSGLKIGFKPTPHLAIYATGVGAARKIEDVSGNGQYFPIYAATLSADITPLPGWQWRLNAFAGRNLQNSGSALTLASASLSFDQSEWGGFLSTRFHFLEHHAVHATFGVDRLFILENASNGSLVENAMVRAGYAFLWRDKLEAFLEWCHSKSGYRLNAGVDRFDSDTAEAGIVFRI